MACLLPPPALRALETGKLTDPFAMLGYHPAPNSGGSGSLIRIFNPAFRSVAIEHDGGVMESTHASGTGCFEVLFPGRPEALPYRVRASLHSGEALDYRDPYAFPPVLQDSDRQLLGRGEQYRLWEKLGGNLCAHRGITGAHFAVWAPGARGVSVLGDFNAWNPHSHMLRLLGKSGVWEIFAPDAQAGMRYKFLIHTPDGARIEKTDPMAREIESRPGFSAILTDSADYSWKDWEWELNRPATSSENFPLSIYEVHAGSWRSARGEKHLAASASSAISASYPDLAAQLIPYVRDMGYTHIELMPLQEHALEESWGYQVTGYYAPARRYGSPRSLKAFVEACHLAGIGVILDWVPSHFPVDAHGLDGFDGTQLYAHPGEPANIRKDRHPEWITRVFNHGRSEVANFLIANALYWLEEFHVDGLRMKLTGSMLHPGDAGGGDPKPGTAPGSQDGNIRPEAVQFLRRLNSIVATRCPGRLLIAEEPSSLAKVTRVEGEGGLGFQYQWNGNWRRDFLTYFCNDPVFRRYHQDLLTFEMSHAFSESFLLALSHEDVAPGKGSLLNKMPGDAPQKFANIRAALAYMYAHPGKKLHFMGMEFGQNSEWNAKGELAWGLLESDAAGGWHRGLQALVRDLNGLYRRERALHELDSSYEGFRWIDFQDREQNVLSLQRRSRPVSVETGREIVVCVFNFGALPRHSYRIGVPSPGRYGELLSTDSKVYGGGTENRMDVETSPVPMHGLPCSLELSLPPLSALYLRRI